MNMNNSLEEAHSENEDQIANMSNLDFLTLLWEARIVGSEYVLEKTGS